jgi:hypothetical protein
VAQNPAHRAKGMAAVVNKDIEAFPDFFWHGAPLQ